MHVSSRGLCSMVALLAVAACSAAEKTSVPLQGIFSRTYDEPESKPTIVLATRSFPQGEFTEQQLVGYLAANSRIQEALGNSFSLRFVNASISPLAFRLRSDKSSYSLVPDRPANEFVDAELVVRNGTVEDLAGREVTIIAESGATFDRIGTFPGLMADANTYASNQIVVQRCSLTESELHWKPWSGGKKVSVDVVGQYKTSGLDIGYFSFTDSDFARIFPADQRKHVDEHYGQIETGYIAVLVTRKQLVTITPNGISLDVSLEAQLGVETNFIYENCGLGM